MTQFGTDNFFLIISPTLQLIDVIPILLFPPATEAEAKTLNNADDGDAQEEGHQAPKFCHKLHSVLREVGDALKL